ncbi:CHAP domain-containing protein [Sphingobacterium wenxiniae]|uniref:CHAP domain-containing protein n=1 Tax=Sphingobacterium wenxiniae TaxID=683125 RepID=A0A1I6TII6_9SPHI|nr:CHAP domain-containing protein [Sphingobacterium wenxiniae]SFS88966.1 CHAP domain-containing protein [Sphingobacterium wenxiniae]
MATMYNLFFGILFIAVCSAVYVKNYAVGADVSILRQAQDDNFRQAQDVNSGIVRLSIFRPVTLSLSKRNRSTPADPNIYREKDVPPLACLAQGDGRRWTILQIATAEIGVHEATGNNDGKRVEEYLAYTGLGKGHQWCAAFVSWCYGQAGLSRPRNPWSPALFPKEKTYRKGTHEGRPYENPIQSADVFGIYGISAKRINHVGLVKSVQGKYLITIEGNSNDRVESRRRHLSTIYALADWLKKT